MRFKEAVLERLGKKRIKRKSEAIFGYYIRKAKRNSRERFRVLQGKRKPKTQRTHKHYLGQIILGPYSVHCRMFDNTLGLYLPDVTSIPPPQLCQPKMPPDIAKCPLGYKITSRWNHWPTAIICWIADWFVCYLKTLL